MAKSKKGGYDNRPLWQWILIYLVIGVVVYGLIYYFIFGKSFNLDGSQSSNSATSSGQPIATPSSKAPFSY
ncbi:MAG: hypothetical protein HYW45_01190 [Candidatus Daviesbacteria bacterium]|nr:MAG: hypothetical protein HYW45_01190 [Candidatus Daviesbacteria bacterium]